MQALQKWDRSQSGELQLFEGRKPFKLLIMDVLWIHPYIHTGENTIPIWRIVVIMKEGSLITY